MRQVHCVSKDNKEVDESECTKAKPTAMKECQRQKCNQGNGDSEQRSKTNGDGGFGWKKGKWAEVSHLGLCQPKMHNEENRTTFFLSPFFTVLLLPRSPSSGPPLLSTNRRYTFAQNGALAICDTIKEKESLVAKFNS